jgi:hypothetical protein
MERMMWQALSAGPYPEAVGAAARRVLLPRHHLQYHLKTLPSAPKAVRRPADRSVDNMFAYKKRLPDQQTRKRVDRPYQGLGRAMCVRYTGKLELHVNL